MRYLVLPLMLVFLGFAPLTAQAASGTPKLYGILFYADWCGSCKILDPQIEKARGKADLDNEDVLFVRLDLTDAATRHQASLLASALGIGEFYDANAGKTGFMLLADPATGAELGRLNKDMDSGQITVAITDALAKTP